MRTRLLATVIVAATLIPGAVLAQGRSGMGSGGMSSEQTAQQLPQQIKDKLEQFGLTDVKVLPRSFVVTGKDKNGDQVNMLIGPHAMLVLTESGTESGTTGSSGTMSPNK